MTTKEVFDFMKEEVEDILWGDIKLTGEYIMWEYSANTWDEDFEETMDDVKYDDMEQIKSFFEENNIEYSIMDFDRDHDYMSCYIETE